MRPALTALALLAAPALAQSPADTVKIPAGTYQVDTQHTQVLFTVRHFGVSFYTGQFTQPTGSLTIHPGQDAQDKLDITFAIKDVATSVAHLNEHLQTPDFFDSAKYPTAHFVSTSVRPSGTSAVIAGNLTMHGVTRPVTLQAKVVGAGHHMGDNKPYVGFQATATVKRSDFGLTYAMGPIPDEVPLTINAAFIGA